MQTNNRAANLLGALALAVTDEFYLTIRKRGNGGPSEAAALVEIATWPKETIDSLSRTLRLSPAGTTRLVDRLVREGLVTRDVGDADRRARTLSTTEAGRARVAVILAARREALDRALSQLDPEDQSALELVLERMLAAMTPDRETCDHTCRLCDIDSCPPNVCPVEQAARDKDR
ncbi:MarR family winged helix-turn-helix transcriptional regulator [Rhizobium terrae]|uniref:MarR family winged helix-turn-helix transcriptional regulator n=1 Tax=Rhizobium terrae TaxID=2171756 RepID=UPI000E3BBC2E|nr:MarR family transcriptional regulator [Rhizobium terrae]